eukprot:6646074-Prymnesium_polylepis.1
MPRCALPLRMALASLLFAHAGATDADFALSHQQHLLAEPRRSAEAKPPTSIVLDGANLAQSHVHLQQVCRACPTSVRHRTPGC